MVMDEARPGATGQYVIVPTERAHSCTVAGHVTQALLAFHVPQLYFVITCT
uniref:Uncharacterized protein n=1 Tax=Anguilla anguilla TaxID=7936 RepID=A0A0E9WJL2_ANGAN